MTAETAPKSRLRGEARARLRRALARSLLSFALLMGSVAAGADERERHVVVVKSSTAKVFDVAAEAIRHHPRLRDCRVTIVTGRELAVGGIPDCDAIVALGTPALRWLLPRVRDDVELSYGLVADAVGQGVAADGPHAGVTIDVAFSDQYRVVRQALPRARHVGFLFRRSSDRSRRLLAAARADLPEGWELTAVDIDAAGSLAVALRRLLRERPDIIWTYGDSSVFGRSAIQYLLQHTLERGPPVFGMGPAIVRSGALVGVDVQPGVQGAQVAEIVAAQLAGKRPPAISHARAGAAANVEVARRLDIELPGAFLASARRYGE